MEKKENYKIISEIEVAFARLIGPLSIMSVLDSYKKEHKEIKGILDIIVKWGAIFAKKENLFFINANELLDIYNRLESIKDKFLFDSNLGNESELSDEAVIWMWEIMLLRKKQIERNEENGKK